MDWMLVNQLKAEVTFELKDIIPKGYFEQELGTFELKKELDPSGLLSKQSHWGYLAAKLGHDLQQSNTQLMSAKQKCACQLMLFIAFYESTKSAKDSCKKLHQHVSEKGIKEHNSLEVSKQHEEMLKVHERSVKKTLRQYLFYLDSEKAKVFYSAFTEADLVEFGIKQSRIQRWIASTQKHLATIVVAVITSVCSVYALSLLGLKP